MMIEKIYYICVDLDIYSDGKYDRTDSWQEGFWVNKPTNEEVEKYNKRVEKSYLNELEKRE